MELISDFQDIIIFCFSWLISTVIAAIYFCFIRKDNDDYYE